MTIDGGEAAIRMLAHARLEFLIPSRKSKDERKESRRITNLEEVDENERSGIEWRPLIALGFRPGGTGTKPILVPPSADREDGALEALE
jgi:hypothetical protein